MGLYDTLVIDDERCVCSEGHGLSDVEFQTKDLGETMGHWTISGGRVFGQAGGWGVEPDVPLNEKLEVYTSCPKCPAFVQAGTGNLVDCPVDFEIEIRDNVVQSMKRVSPDTAEFVRTTPVQPWMQGCAGPMAYELAFAVSTDFHLVSMRWSPEEAATAPIQAAIARLADQGIPADRWIREHAERRAEMLRELGIKPKEKTNGNEV